MRDECEGSTPLLSIYTLLCALWVSCGELRGTEARLRAEAISDLHKGGPATRSELFASVLHILPRNLYLSIVGHGSHGFTIRVSRTSTAAWPVLCDNPLTLSRYQRIWRKLFPKFNFPSASSRYRSIAIARIPLLANSWRSLATDSPILPTNSRQAMGNNMYCERSLRANYSRKRHTRSIASFGSSTP